MERLRMSSNEACSVTILTCKCAKVPSSRLAQTISIMGLRSPSTSTGVLHLNEFIEKRIQVKFLPIGNKKDGGGNGVKTSLINLLQLFLRLFGNISCYKPFATLVVSWCCCSCGKGTMLEWRDACRGWQEKLGPNSANQRKHEKT